MLQLKIKDILQLNIEETTIGFGDYELQQIIPVDSPQQQLKKLREEQSKLEIEIRENKTSFEKYINIFGILLQQREDFNFQLVQTNQDIRKQQKELISQIEELENNIKECDTKLQNQGTLLQENNNTFNDLLQKDYKLARSIAKVEFKIAIQNLQITLESEDNQHLNDSENVLLKTFKYKANLQVKYAEIDRQIKANKESLSKLQQNQQQNNDQSLEREILKHNNELSKLEYLQDSINSQIQQLVILETQAKKDISCLLSPSQQDNQDNQQKLKSSKYWLEIFDKKSKEVLADTLNITKEIEKIEEEQALAINQLQLLRKEHKKNEKVIKELELELMKLNINLKESFSQLTISRSLAIDYKDTINFYNDVERELQTNIDANQTKQQHRIVTTQTQNDVQCHVNSYKKIKNMKFFFVRHGETQYNTEGVAQGVDDSEKSQLNETGKKQAVEAASKLLKDSDLKGRVAIVTSFLGRAKETGQIIFEQLKKCGYNQKLELFEYGSLEQKTGLHEIDMGGLNAKLSKNQLAEHFGGAEKLNEFLIGNNGDLNAGFTEQNGENREVVRSRCRKSIEELQKTYSDEFDAIIIVSHRYTIAEIIRMNGQKLDGEVKNSEYFKAETSKNMFSVQKQEELKVVGGFTQKLKESRQQNTLTKQLNFSGLAPLETYGMFKQE